MIPKEARLDHSSKQTPILVTKLTIPRAVARTVKRQRLIERLRWGMRNKATVLCAPAGFGKSTLLAQWADQAADRPAWYSLDPGDNDPARFWSYVVAAIDRIRPGFGERAAEAVKLLHSARHEAALTRLAVELRHLEGGVALVLDDFHVLADEELLASLDFFIDKLPDNVRLLIASRTRPAFLSGGKRSLPASVSLLETADLRFSLQEGDSFYSQCMELELSEEETEEWVNRTEGWITGMKLAALSLRCPDRSSRLLRNSPAASHSLHQYLLEEVLAWQSEPIRRFLMENAVLRRFDASLCRAVTGDERSGERLDYLEKAQLFLVALDDSRTWFRFHHLFAEFLFQRLQRLEPDRVPELLERAGLECERQELYEEALDYYLSGGHFQRAVGLLHAMPVKRMRAGTTWLNRQFARIPEPILSKHPLLYFSYLHSALVGDADYVRAKRMLSYVEQQYEANAPGWTEEDKSDFRGGYHLLQMLYFSMVEHNHELSMRHFHLFKQAKPDGIRLIFAKPKVAGQPSITREHVRSGTGLSEKEKLIGFLDGIVASGNETFMATLPLASLAEFHYEFNNLDEAERNAKRALQAEMALFLPDQIAAVLPSRLTLFRVRKARGERTEAAAMLRETRSEVVEMELTGSLIYCDAESALLALEDGDAGPAEEWLRQYPLQVKDEIGERLYEYQYFARILAALGRLAEALDLTERLRELATRTDRFQSAFEISVSKAVLLHRMELTDDALAVLGPTLLVAEQRGYERTFLDAGEPMAALLEILTDSWDWLPEGEYPPLAYVRELLARFGRSVSPGAKDADEAAASELTKKELEVLRLIVRRKANKDIAAELGIGRETVKTHIKNIYSKLEASSRAEAVRKGEQMGL